MENSQKQTKHKPTQPPIYPFYIKFSSQKQKTQSNSNPHPYSSVSTQPFPDDDDSQDQQQYYNQSFQSYKEENYQQSIHQEQQDFEDSEPQNIFEEEVVAINYHENPSEVSDDLDRSIQFLRRENERMIRLKQQFRAIATKYKYNIDILHRQRQELQVLRNLRDKAMDCDYQFHISQEYERDRVYSHNIVSSITKEASLIKKNKYRRIKQQNSLNDPSDSCCILSNSRILDSKAVDMFTLVKKREEVLNKRRQEQLNKAKLVILQRKQDEYKQILDVYDNYSIKGSDNKKKRIQLLKQQIQLKRNMFSTKEAGINLDISSLKKELLTLATKIAVFEDQIEEMVKEKPQEEISNAKFNTFASKNSYSKITKKISSKVSPSDIKLDKIQTPKSKLKIIFNQQMGTPMAKQKLFKPNSHRYNRQRTTQN